MKFATNLFKLCDIFEMHLKIDGEPHALTNEEVEPAVGAYDFRDIPNMVDRFIIWLFPSRFLFLLYFVVL